MKNDTLMKQPAYEHTQRAPLCLVLYGVGAILLVLSLVFRAEPGIVWVLPTVGSLMLFLAASFTHLRVKDLGERLSIGFDPISLFRRTVRYEDIDSATIDRTTILDGWGIHMSIRGGWVWNIWGRDCVLLQPRKGLLRIGTDDTEGLLEVVNTKLSQRKTAN